MIKKVLLGSLVIIVLICAAGALFLYSAVNKVVEEQFASTCTDIPLPGSGEDNQIDRERGFAYLSVFDRLAGAKGEPTEPGTRTRILVSEIDDLALGPVVDAAVDVLAVDVADLDDPPPLATQAGYDAARAVVRREGEAPILVLSMEHVLESVYRSGLDGEAAA